LPAKQQHVRAARAAHAAQKITEKLGHDLASDLSLSVYQLNSPNAARRKPGGYTSAPDSVSLKLDDLFFQYQ
jgi:hypothetical protein